MQPSGTAGAPSLSVSVNAATNRLTASGATYDNNGNVTAGFAGLNLYYDAVNRIAQVQTTGGSSYYGYDPDNLRVYSRNAASAETIYFYGADGKKLAVYTYTIITYDGNPEIQLTQQSENVYFTGILISASTDRLGSVTQNSSGSHHYYPYGVEYTASTNDTEKYATYTRDSLTGLDYAMNRYYSSQWGRFLSPDPSTRGVNPKNPLSWNRYSYVLDDPTNSWDPSGTDTVVDCMWTACAFNAWAVAAALSNGTLATYGSHGAYLSGPLASQLAIDEAQYTAFVATLLAVVSGTPIAAGALTANKSTNPCSALLSLPSGLTISSLFSQVYIEYQDLGDTDTYVEEFNPGADGNPNPSHYKTLPTAHRAQLTRSSTN
jgi:RHS repeat-associated protein